MIRLYNHLSCIRVDNLRDKVILVDVHTRLLAALKGNAWTAGFRQAVDIVGPNAQLILNILPHLLAPCLRAEDTCFQFNLIPQSALMDALRQKRRIRRGTAQNGCLQIHHKL